MNSRVLVIVGGVIVVAAVVAAFVTYQPKAAPSQTSSDTPPTQSTDTNASVTTADAMNVTIQNYAYSPAKITVKKGTKITWTNQDEVRHDVMSDDNSPQKGLESDLLGKGQSYSYTFNTAGTYTYHCSLHPYMKGTVEVTD
jgi:amicyanin